MIVSFWGAYGVAVFGYLLGLLHGFLAGRRDR
jgi:hypothetical protein